MMGDRQVVDLEGDGVCEYVARGSIDGAAVFDHQGALLWTYGQYTKENTGIDNLTIGDLDGDGVAEFVVSWDGIEVFDKSGNRRSQVKEEYGDSQIEVVDTDGDGKNELFRLSPRSKSGRHGPGIKGDPQIFQPLCHAREAGRCLKVYTRIVADRF
jgi:hypothetical protein